MTASPLRIGLAGLGTVGTGVAKILAAHPSMIAARAGRPIKLAAVSARNRHRDRGVDLSTADWEDDPVALAGRDDIDVLVEVIGGEDGPAKAACERALGAGHHVVTANKALLAHHGESLAGLAEQNGAALRFEAAVAGGIPIVKALGEGLAANGLSRVYGVLNGTCNYILTEMARTGRDYAEVLAEAQAKGYAEADPAFDVGGIDAGHKLSLLAALAFGCRVDFAGVAIEGIERVTLADIRHAAAFGFAIKLLGIARRESGAIVRTVQPCLVAADSAIGQLPGVTNAVVCEGDFVGQTVYEGPGAGEGPTASAVVADLIDIARGNAMPAFGAPAETLVPLDAAPQNGPAPHYLRFRLQDRPGALAAIAQALGEQSVSIRAMHQDGEQGETAMVVILTHACPRPGLDRALAAIATQPACLDTPVALRIEDV